MPPHEALAQERSEPSVRGVFTLKQANDSLVLVRKIVEDICRCYQQLCDMRAQLTELESAGVHEERREALRERCDERVDVLNRLYRELLDIGCVLKDWRIGLVDFPAVFEGRRIWFCWRLGEASVTHWHELNDGFSGRKPITGLM